MRVITGQYKGHRLFSPKDKAVRPTTDRTREFLFSFIGEKIVAASVLDLFAGTGSVGIEALSRQATSAVFVDQSKQACELIQRNLSKVGATANVIRASAKNYLLTDPRQYDLVFCDPPYRYPHIAGLFDLIIEKRIVNAGGWLIYESAAREEIPLVEGLSVLKEKKLGTTKITVMEWHEP